MEHVHSAAGPAADGIYFGGNYHYRHLPSFFFKNKHLTSQRVSKNLAHTLRLSEGSLKVAQCGLFSHLVSHHDHQSYCADWMASLCAQKDLLSAQQKRRDYYAEASRTFWTQEPARSAQGCQAYMISW